MLFKKNPSHQQSINVSGVHQFTAILPRTAWSKESCGGSGSVGSKPRCSICSWGNPTGFRRPKSLDASLVLPDFMQRKPQKRQGNVRIKQLFLVEKSAHLFSHRSLVSRKWLDPHPKNSMFIHLVPLIGRIGHLDPQLVKRVKSSQSLCDGWSLQSKKLDVRS